MLIFSTNDLYNPMTRYVLQMILVWIKKNVVVVNLYLVMFNIDMLDQVPRKDKLCFSNSTDTSHGVNSVILNRARCSLEVILHPVFVHSGFV
jgi:hypothetical protein